MWARLGTAHIATNHLFFKAALTSFALFARGGACEVDWDSEQAQFVRFLFVFLKDLVSDRDAFGPLHPERATPFKPTVLLLFISG